MEQNLVKEVAMSELYDMGLIAPSCNGCKLAQLKYELGDKFLKLASGIYEIDALPEEGQADPTMYNGHVVRFRFRGIDYGHSDECYHWKPPKQ